MLGGGLGEVRGVGGGEGEGCVGVSGDGQGVCEWGVWWRWVDLHWVEEEGKRRDMREYWGGWS